MANDRPQEERHEIAGHDEDRVAIRVWCQVCDVPAYAEASTIDDARMDLARHHWHRDGNGDWTCARHSQPDTVMPGRERG